MIYGGVPAFFCFGMTGWSYANFLAPPVGVGKFGAAWHARAHDLFLDLKEQKAFRQKHDIHVLSHFQNCGSRQERFRQRTRLNIQQAFKVAVH